MGEFPRSGIKPLEAFASGVRGRAQYRDFIVPGTANVGDGTVARVAP